MKRRFRRIVILIALLGLIAGGLFEAVTHVGRGWLGGEPFYDGRPASYWAAEIELWESQDPDWQTKTYVRRAAWPRWAERVLPERRWPGLLDGDPDGLAVLQALGKHPSGDVRDWARIGIERIDNGERGPCKINHPSVILTAQLFEVDEAFYNQVATGKWLSMVELEKMERIFLDGAEKEQKEPAEESLLRLLGKQKPLLSVKDIKIDDGKEGMLLSLTKEIHCLPSPLQLRKGQKDPQKIEEGVTLRAHVQISADRRYVRVKFIEKSSELEGIDKVALIVDNKGGQAVAEIPCVKESTFSILRTIPDGGTLLLPLQYRPAASKEKGRRLVVRIVPRIYIEAEERLIRGELEK